MRKRQFIKFFFSVLLCLVMLAACGNDSSSKGSEKNEDEEEITEGSFVGTWGEDDDEHLTLDEDGEGVFISGAKTTTSNGSLTSRKRRSALNWMTRNTPANSARTERSSRSRATPVIST